MRIEIVDKQPQAEIIGTSRDRVEIIDNLQQVKVPTEVSDRLTLPGIKDSLIKNRKSEG